MPRKRLLAPRGSEPMSPSPAAAEYGVDQGTVPQDVTVGAAREAARIVEPDPAEHERDTLPSSACASTPVPIRSPATTD